MKSLEAERIPAEDVSTKQHMHKTNIIYTITSNHPTDRNISPRYNTHVLRITCSQNTIIHPDQHKYIVYYKDHTNSNTHVRKYYTKSQ